MTADALGETVRVVLIGGSSHAGKSTLAQALAERLGFEALSTDSLARHPGRPWRPPPMTVPDHVAEHFLTLSPDELLADVLRHYNGMWPMVSNLIAVRAADPNQRGLVLEGSALWPENVATLAAPGVRAVWLTASPAMFRRRMLENSGYARADPRGQAMIDSFLARTLLYDQAMMAAVRRLGLPFVDLGEGLAADALVKRGLEALGIEA